MQEAINNAKRHARATNIHVQVCCKQQSLCFCIRDDGVGFDLGKIMRDADPRAGFGILGMQERARIAGGAVAVQSEPGFGTRIEVEFPLSVSEGRADAGAQALPAREAVATDAAALSQQGCGAAAFCRGAVSH